MVVMAAFSVYVPVLQFHLIGIAHMRDLAGKEKRNAGHRVVKVQLHLVQSDPGNGCLKRIALIILQGEDFADFEQPIGYFTFVFEHTFIHFDQRGFIVFAVRIGRLDGESKLVAGFEPRQVAFKFRKHTADPKDETQRFIAFRRFNQFAGSIVFRKGVVDNHHFFFFNNHLIIICEIPEGRGRRFANSF